MGFDPVTATALKVGSTVIGGAAGLGAAKAQEQAGEFQAELLETQIKNDRKTLTKNVANQKEDQERYLSRVRLLQANNGTVVGEGTSELLFDDITSRTDERLFEFQQQGLANLGRLQNAATQARFQGKQQAKATRLATLGGVLKGSADSFNTFRSVSNQTTPGQYKGLYNLFG